MVFMLLQYYSYHFLAYHISNYLVKILTQKQKKLHISDALLGMGSFSKKYIAD